METFIDETTLPETTRMFVPLAKSTWNLALNQQDRKMVYQEVEKQFDGDYNVLLETLITRKMAANRSKPNEALQVFDSQIKDFTQQVMKESKERVYPQIFIPFYEDLKQKGKLGTAQPVLVFRDGPPTTDGKYRGYAFKDGALVDRGSISERFARENEVWVISMNESSAISSEGDTNNQSQSRIQTFGTTKFRGLTIHGKENMKEDWIGGKSEVSLTIRNLHDGYNLGPEDIYYYSVGTIREINGAFFKVANVSRKAAKNNTYQYLLNQNIWFVRDWYYNPDYKNKPYVVYALFEYDPWPAGVKTLYYIIAQDTIVNGYRSYESPWVHEQLHRTTVENYWYEDGKIGFILE